MEIPACKGDALWTAEQKQGYDAFFKGIGLSNLASILHLSPTGAKIHYAEEGWLTGWRRAYGMGVKASAQATGAKCPLSGSAPIVAWGLGYEEEPYLDGDV